MNDDLISRKDFITEMEINIGDIYNPDIIKGMKFAIDLINSRPTVFDKEKVIKKLKHLEKDTFDYYNRYNDEMAFGESAAFRLAIEIVEKGGIE